MVKHLRKTLATMAVLMVSAVASATPFKGVYVELTVNETGRGKVYLQSEDPDNQQTRKSEDVVMKCVLGENGNDTLRTKVTPAYMYPGAPATCIADSLTGLYMVWLNAEPEDGYELAGYSLIKKDDPDAYTKADLIKSTWTDNGNFTDPYSDNENEFIFNANVPRSEDAKGDGSDAGNNDARETARQKASWGDTPDWKIYAVFVKEGTVLPDGNATVISQVQTKNTTTEMLYSIDGHKVPKTYKGLVIRDGKKYLQK